MLNVHARRGWQKIVYKGYKSGVYPYRTPEALTRRVYGGVFAHLVWQPLLFESYNNVETLEKLRQRVEKQHIFSLVYIRNVYIKRQTLIFVLGIN